MAYVYAVVFDGNIVKFGRSIDPHKRISNHVSDGKRYGQKATLAFVSQVKDCCKVEGELLVQASWAMDEVSQESFKFKNLDEVTSCFDAVRIDYMAFKVASNPYRLVVDEATFKFDHDSHVSLSVDDDPLLRVKRSIAECISGKQSVSMAIVKACNRNKRVADIKACILEMEASGHIKIERWRDPFRGTPSGDLERAKFTFTEKMAEYLR